MISLRLVLLATALVLSFGCTTINQSARQEVPFDQEWAVLPFLNNTETPYAGERAESVAVALLYARGVSKLASYPNEKREDDLLTDRGTKRRQEALEWAKRKGLRYALSGTVTEWRYKVGLDGEPVAGVTLQILDLQDGGVLWSGSGSKSGWSRDAVSAVAQQVMGKLIDSIPARSAVPAL